MDEHTIRMWSIWNKSPNALFGISENVNCDDLRKTFVHLILQNK